MIEQPFMVPRLAVRGQARQAHCAMTMIEVLVVISIVGMLMSLLLPAVQAARESARRNTCQNHVKQLGLAMLNHESAKRYFPSGGWGFAWVGDPDRGTGLKQPGGWTYDLLPYLERTDLARIGAGIADAQKKKAAVTTVLPIPLDVFNCPTRRPLGVSPFDPTVQPVNFNVPPAVAESDYAVNAGDYVVVPNSGPASYAAAENGSFQWPDTSKCTGIVYLRSLVEVARVRDGTSHTYLAGEKCLTLGAVDYGDDQGLYAGYDYDTVRWTIRPPLHDQGGTPVQEFGSAHPNGFQVVFCDGSVRQISFEIDASVHRRLGNRQDGVPIDDAMIK